MVNKEAYDSNILYVIVDHDKLDYYQYEVDIFNNNLYNSKKQQLRKIDTFAYGFETIAFMFSSASLLNWIFLECSSWVLWASSEDVYKRQAYIDSTAQN